MTYDCKTGRFTFDGDDNLVVENQTNPFYGSKEYEEQKYKKQLKKDYKKKTGVFIWVLGITKPNSKWVEEYRGIGFGYLDYCVRYMGARYDRPETFNLVNCSISYNRKNDDENVFITENDAKMVLKKKRWFSYNGREFESTLEEQGYEIIKIELPKKKLAEYYDAIKTKKKRLMDEKKKLLKQTQTDVDFYDSELKYMNRQLRNKKK